METKGEKKCTLQKRILLGKGLVSTAGRYGTSYSTKMESAARVGINDYLARLSKQGAKGQNI